VQMRPWERWVCGGAAFMMVIPGLVSTLIGLALVVPVLLRHFASMKRPTVAAA